MTPSQTIVRAAIKTLTVVDRGGRRLSLRRLTALDTLRLFKAAGPVLSQNGAWLSMAGLAFSVLEIDGIPVPALSNEAQVEGLIERLGDDGLAAIADTIKEDPDESDTGPLMGNLPGIPS